MTTTTTTAPPGESATRLAQQQSWWERVNKATLVMAGVTLAVCVFFAVASDAFLTFANISNVATQVAPVVIIGVAMTFVITSGQIDLSVGSIVAFVSAVSAQLLQTGWDSSLVLIAGVLLGAGWGLVNGWFTAYAGIPAFIVTLATLSVIRGIALLTTEGFSVPIERSTFVAQLGTARWLGFSSSAWIALVCVVLGIVVLHRTRFGQYVIGIGSAEESVRRAGVNVRRIKMLALCLSGLAAGVAGLLIAARLGSGSANAAQGFELTVIAAVVIGGTSLFGGRGTVVGTLIGAILTGVIANGLTLMGVSPFLTPIITGTVLLAVIWVNLRGKDIGGALRGLVGGR
ncbi:MULTISPECIES: ABC transporter permease [unclassified Modestobacter]|uniref:ABC transporter permease n=1 Tax=unclassified Modestobacter TaxID=2643866 RepID=UPI0022AAA775|nr:MULTISPECIES: ABC transporter permease [unclassified Modestobacter]MCZ2810973.1 ABC transporter permease [Modestobacter sp. VKM Ac-2979]MCZ2840486.1 ABC transporter permease [Modestobacter sp. VKM Ac-2980]MCZ2849613.1 ABC transporter permease [Modestobacter sp. VKM Ac-2978]